eukprot:11183851-Lingulodinium_polyedra.AAC.1
MSLIAQRDDRCLFIRAREPACCCAMYNSSSYCCIEQATHFLSFQWRNNTAFTSAGRLNTTKHGP